MPTYIPKADQIARKWYVIDAKDQVLGKLATTAAVILTGKSKPIYTTFLDTGDHVIVINASKVRVSGMKAETKQYHRYTGYPGGLRSEVFRKRIVEKPEELLRDAIVGMLPHTKMGRAMARKLKVYRGDKHPHEAQKPEPAAPVKRAQEVV
jgi:large subunit ribosomal protein L13